MLFLNGLFCSVGTQVEMKISAGGGGALARDKSAPIQTARFVCFLIFVHELLSAYPYSQRNKHMGLGLEVWKLLRNKDNSSAMAAAQRC